MPLSQAEIDQMKTQLLQHVRNYPDMDALLAEGRVSYKSGWYEIIDPAAFSLLSKYVESFRKTKQGKLLVKMSKLSERLIVLAEKV